MSENPKPTAKRKTPSKPPKSFYLGSGAVYERRLQSIEAIAAQFGTTRSVLLQKIADGELVVIKRGKKPGEGE